MYTSEFWVFFDDLVQDKAYLLGQNTSQMNLYSFGNVN